MGGWLILSIRFNSCAGCVRVQAGQFSCSTGYTSFVGLSNLVQLLHLFLILILILENKFKKIIVFRKSY